MIESFKSPSVEGVRRRQVGQTGTALATVGEGDFDFDQFRGSFSRSWSTPSRSGAFHHKKLSIFVGFNDAKRFGLPGVRTGMDVFAHYSAKAESVWNVRNP
jgi:hypothetical protein